MTLQRKILSNYSSLKNSTKIIADIFLKNPRAFLIKNTQELADYTKTSGASIVRFCQKLGFSGLKEFQLALATEMPQPQEKKIDTIINKNDDPVKVLYKLNASWQADSQDMIKTLNKDNLIAAVKIISNAENVFLEGVGASGLAAQDLFYKLIRFGKKVIYIPDSHIDLEKSVFTTNKDVMIAFSYSGLTKEVLMAVEQAKKNKTPIIAITRNKLSPLSENSDILLALPTTEKLLRFGAVTSLFSEIFMSSLIYLSIISPNLDNLSDNMKLTQQITNKLKEKDYE